VLLCVLVVPRSENPYRDGACRRPDQIADARNFIGALRAAEAADQCALMDWQLRDPVAVRPSQAVLRCRLNSIKDEPLLGSGEGTKNDGPRQPASAAPVVLRNSAVDFSTSPHLLLRCPGRGSLAVHDCVSA
jgi:hypothetical protein